jgi:hypothetical protein
MEAANLETLVEKVKAVAHGPQADLLRKFVDLLYQPAGERERRERAAQTGRQPGAGTHRPEIQDRQPGGIDHGSF